MAACGITYDLHALFMLVRASSIACLFLLTIVGCDKKSETLFAHKPVATVTVAVKYERHVPVTMSSDWSAPFTHPKTYYAGLQINSSAQNRNVQDSSNNHCTLAEEIS